eukprot:g4387.t1
MTLLFQGRHFLTPIAPVRTLAILKPVPMRLRCPSIKQRVVMRSQQQSKTDISSTEKVEKEDSDLPTWVSTAGGFIGWAAFLGYSFFLSPNQTPNRDLYFIQKASNFFPNDGFHLNTVFGSYWILFGVVSFAYAALLIPAGRSKNKVPVWPFLTLSVAFGNFALLPYAALWQPDESIVCPPTKEELTGWTKFGLRITESAVIPALLMLPTLWLVGQIVFCGGDEWIAFYQYFQESRLVHVSCLDFLSLVLLLPFWMNNDATFRKWKAKDQFVPILSFVPLIGPSKKEDSFH